jgi:prophage regulatory protein
MKERLIRLNEVIRITGLSRSRIYQYIAEGRFPDNVSIGGRSVAWVESEVNQWVESVIGRRDNNIINGFGWC